MPEIENRSGFPHFCFEKMGPNGMLFDVLLVRGTFDFASGEREMSISEAQRPVVVSDEYAGQTEETPLKGALRQTSDVALGKMATDVYAFGVARTKDRKPQEKWRGRLQVGPVSHSVQFFGPREMRRGLVLKFSWELSAAEPVEYVELDDRYAFGGCFVSCGVEVSNEHNGAGRGWLPNDELWRYPKEVRKELEGVLEKTWRVLAPQIEHPKHLVKFPQSTIAAAGFGPLPMWSKHRVQYAGSYDEKWKRERYPLMPKDFDMRFYQVSRPELICPGFLEGGEAVELEGLTEEGFLSMKLPVEKVLARVEYASGKSGWIGLSLDTVELDLEARQAVLKWRSVLGRIDPAKALRIEKARRKG